MILSHCWIYLSSLFILLVPHAEAVVFGEDIELFPWLVYIQADPGTNCTLIVNVPTKNSAAGVSQHVEMSMKKTNGYIDGIFDIETIGKSLVHVPCRFFSRSGVDHLHLISSSNLNLTVTGSPSNADLYITGGFGSEILIRELYTHALISNFALVTIGSNVLSRKCAIIVVGASEIALDVYTTSRYGYFYNGCLNLPEIVPNPYSDWMRYGLLWLVPLLCLSLVYSTMTRVFHHFSLI